MKERKVAIVYAPVLHRGYIDFIKSLEQEGVEALYLIGDEILLAHEELDYLNRKDRLRALTEKELAQTLGTLTSLPIEIFTTDVAHRIPREGNRIIMPSEDVSMFIAGAYLSGSTIEYRNVFLRRNKNNLDEESEARGMSVAALPAFERSIMSAVLREAEKSADWWRQVGAALVKDGKLLALAHNEHMPEKELPNIVGDSRSLFKKGMNVEYVTAAHAEVAAIGEAARKGMSTEGAELFVTDFPCPYCARLIAKSGIKKIYFTKGYAVLGGEDFFRDVNIETVKVEVE